MLKTNCCRTSAKHNRLHSRTSDKYSSTLNTERPTLIRDSRCNLPYRQENFLHVREVNVSLETTSYNYDWHQKKKETRLLWSFRQALISLIHTIGKNFPSHWGRTQHNRRRPRAAIRGQRAVLAFTRAALHSRKEDAAAAPCSGMSRRGDRRDATLTPAALTDSTRYVGAWIILMDWVGWCFFSPCCRIDVGFVGGWFLCKESDSIS